MFLLDEPTSGLDPYTDGQMMTLLRNLADKGSTVMLTTHATKNVMLCDKVVFMARGGQLAFVGTPHRALRYFEADAFDEIYRRLVEEGTPEEWSERFRASEDYRQLVSDQLRIDPVEAAAEAAAPEVRAPGGFRRFRHQFPILSQRNRDLYLKNPKTLPSLIMPPVLFTILALTLFRSGAFGSTPNSPAALQILFLIAFSAFIFGLLFGVQSIVSEFPILQRERMVNLGIVPYVLSKLTFFAPVLTVLLILMIAVLRLMGRLPEADLNVYLQLTLTIVLTGLVGLALALLTSAFVVSSQQATDMLSVWIMPQVLFAGALLAVPTMNFVGRMISAICPVRWSFEALGNITDLGDVFRTDTSKIGPGLAIQYAGSFTAQPDRELDHPRPVRRRAAGAHVPGPRPEDLDTWSAGSPAGRCRIRGARSRDVERRRPLTGAATTGTALRAGGPCPSCAGSTRRSGTRSASRPRGTGRRPGSPSGPSSRSGMLGS